MINFYIEKFKKLIQLSWFSCVQELTGQLSTHLISGNPSFYKHTKNFEKSKEMTIISACNMLRP